MFKNKDFCWDSVKNDLLKKERGIGFEEIVDLIETGHVLALRDHHNMLDYPHQKIIEVDVAGYVYCIPCLVNERDVFLKTIFPSRKATKAYKKENNL